MNLTSGRSGASGSPQEWGGPGGQVRVRLSYTRPPGPVGAQGHRGRASLMGPTAGREEEGGEQG